MMVALAAGTAGAQSVWNSTTGNWSAAANWSPAAAPLSASTTSLTFGGGVNYTATNDIGAFSLNQLLFTNTAGTVTLAGSPTTNALTFLNSSNAALPTLVLSGAGGATISSPVIWNADTSVTNSGAGTLAFSGNQTFANGTKQTFINTGTGTITLPDAITYANTGANNGLVLNLINNNPATGSFNIGNIGSLTNLTLNVGGTGTVRFVGNTGGDLFGLSTILNVLAGATFDFNGNTEFMGGISGAGTILSTVSVTAQATGNYVFSGKYSGVGGSLTLSASSQTLDLAGSTSDYTGATIVAGGTLVVSANAPSGSAGALGNATSEVLVGDTTAALSGSLMIDTAGVGIGRNIRVQTGNTGTSTVGGLNTSGTVTYSGNVTLGTDASAAKGVTLYSAPGGTTEFTGNLLRAAGATGTTDAVIVTGGGTVAMRGSNTFTGATTVNNGTLLLDDATNNGSKLSSTAVLTLNGGSLSLLGNSSAPSSQAVASLTLGNSAAPFGGDARITVTSGLNQTVTLALGAITRNTGATVNFSSVNTGTGTAGIATATANTAAGILGGYATFNLNDWAANDGSGNIIALPAASYTTSFGSGLHTSLSASTLLPAGGATANTLRFTGAAALTFSASADTLTLDSGGILVASTAGATSIGAAGTPGKISPTTGELIVHQQSTSGSLTINSAIGGTNLTKTGDGTLVLAATTSTYGGSTYIDDGVVSITATSNLGAATSGITLDGGTLAIPSGSITVASGTGHIITIGPAGGTFNFTASISFSGNGFNGSGPLTKTGAGNWSVGANGSSFSGTINIAAGSLSMTSAQLQSAGTITVASGAAYNINDDGTGTWFAANGAQFLLNGTGVGGTGAFHLTDQTQGTAVTNDPVSTMPRDIVLQTSSLIQTDNGSAAGSLSTLIFSGNISGSGALMKGGNGLLILTGANNTYSGGTAVQGGTLRLNLGNDRLPVSTNVTLGTGTTSGVLQLNGFTQTIAGLATSGTGAANEVTGGSSTSTALLTVNVASGSQTYGGLLGGTGVDNNNSNNNLGFIKDGAGTAVLSGANTYNGSTTVKTGALMLGNANALGNGGAGIAAGTGGTTVAAGATLDLNGQTNVNEIITLNGSGVGGAGALVNNSGTPATLGNGVSSLNVAATTTGWTGGATVTLGAPGSGVTATASALLGITQASLSLTSGGTGFGVTPVVTVSGGGGSGAVIAPQIGVTAASFTITPGTDVYSVAPTVTLSNGATATAILSGGTSGTVTGITVTSPGTGFTTTPTVTFSGGTITSGTTLPTGAGNSSHFTVVGLTVVNAGTGFTSAPTVTITGGTGAAVTANNTNFALNGIAITSNGSGYTAAPGVTVSGGTATATANISSVVLASDSTIGGSGNLTIQSPISGGFALIKGGAGTATLSGANTYSGATTVNAGILQVGLAGVGQSGTGAVNVLAGQLVGTGTVQGSSFTLSSGATLQPGDITSGATTGNGKLTFATSATAAYNLQSGSTTLLGITTATTTDPTFGGNAVGSAGYDSFINAVTGSGNHDLLAFSGGAGSTLTFSGNLTVQGISFTPAAGEVFNLVDWNAMIAANFGGFNLGTNFRDGSQDNGSQFDLPDISGSPGLAWDVSQFTTSGNIAIVSLAPEPGRVMLLLLGLLWLPFRRRRIQ